MLEIIVPANEQYDEYKNEFVVTKEQKLCLEHSLVAISKWESKWHKPFLKNDERSNEEILDYIRCMTITQNVDPNVYRNLTIENYKAINEYIDDPMSATWFREDKRRMRNRDIITSEIIYYWMVALNIPFECQKWHLNRLMTLIRVCNEKNSAPQKMSKSEILSRNKELNEARKKAFNSNG